MRRSLVFRWLAAALAGWSGTRAPPLAAADASPSSDLIVRFKPDTPADRVVAELMRASPPAPAQADPRATGDALAAAQPLAAELARSAGVPLVAVRVSSGRELLLQVARTRWIGELAQRLAADPVLCGSGAPVAVVALPQPPAIVPAARARFATTPAAGSPAAALLEPASAAAQGRRAAALAQRLAGGRLPELALRVEGGQVLIDADLAGALPRIAARLRARADVAYVQLDRLLQPAGAAAGTGAAGAGTPATGRPR